MEAPNKQIRPRDIAVVLLGDITVFLAFVILGKTEHGIIQSRALLRTALPFAMVWCAISPWLGTYSASTLYNLRTTASVVSESLLQSLFHHSLAALDAFDSAR